MKYLYGRARRNGQIVFGFIGVLCVCIALALGMAHASAKAPVRLLILGDSLTAGYGLPVADGFQAQLQAALRAHGANVVLVNGAVSGDTTTDAAARLDWVLAGSKVDAALVELGGNDGLRGLSTVTMQHNLTRILNDLAARRIPVLLSGMIAPPSLEAAYGARFKAVFAALGQRKGVLFDPFFLQGLPGKPGLVQADGLHPNAAGVRIEVKRLLPLILRLITEAKTQH
ncbi:MULTISPECIES: arylesterase [Acidiphilium]|uniref:arylesterase n=1 Tax=Acidiphilium TaxID=522 RepID=UPI00257F4F75|nr:MULTISPECIES: arylesterase [Acidiphilium]HQT85849.1 arylesterase [Acidiphilium rubrum]